MTSTTQEAHVFDMLTPAELSALAIKLSHGSTAFFNHSAAIGRTALYLEKIGKIEAGSDAWKGLWNIRAPFVDAMAELHDLMAEVDATAAHGRDLADA